MRLDWQEDLPSEVRQGLKPQVPGSFKAGWDVARANFGDEVFFYAPSLKRYETTGFKNSDRPFFIPVSVTGGDCKLRCEHCRGKILDSMYHAGSPRKLLDIGAKLRAQGGEGLLISGGSFVDGTVPLDGYLDAIAELKRRGFQIAVHTGLVDEELARGLADAGVDIAMIDIIGSDRTIREVYHLDANTTDFENSLRLLCQSGVKTAPHVVIGLDFGRIGGELNALKMISKYPIWSLVLVVLTSQPDTPMRDVVPPAPEDISRVFLGARRIFPKTPILLGCARPYGDHKIRTDALALKTGLNGIAYPAEGITQLAVELGLKPVFSEQCCSLIYQEPAKEDPDEQMAATRHRRPVGNREHSH